MQLARSALLLALCLPVGVAAAAPTAEQQRLEQIKQDMAEATARQKELEQTAQATENDVAQLQRKLVAAAQSADRASAALNEVETNLKDLSAAALRRQQEIEAQRVQLGQTLALLQRLALTPPATALLQTEGQSRLEKLEANIQLKALLPEIQKRSQAMRESVADLAHLRTALETERQQQLAEQARWEEEQSALNTLVSNRSQRLERTLALKNQEARKLAALAARAKDLQSLMGQLKNTPDVEEATTRALPESATTERRLPLTAPTTVRFGERDSYGSLSQGITLKPRSNAPVMAVAAGRVAFAGPFRGYGFLLVIKHARGFHTVTAGLGTVDVQVGQQVAAGEPLGRMPNSNSPDLYFEVRRNGTPINPLGNAAASLQ